MPSAQELQQLETPVLMDMLASHTADYTRMLTDTHTTEEEYARYNLTIKAIQTEIEIRKKNTTTSSTTDPNLKLPTDPI